MKRRNFLGFLGGAAVAGPSMAKEAVAGLESLAVPTIPYPEMPEGVFGGSVGIHETGEYDHVKWLRERIAEVSGLSGSERRERIEASHITQLDPDLAVNRSMSLQHKVREQKRRNFDRSRNNELRHLKRELSDWLKRQALS